MIYLLPLGTDAYVIATELEARHRQDDRGDGITIKTFRRGRKAAWGEPWQLEGDEVLAGQIRERFEHLRANHSGLVFRAGPDLLEFIERNVEAGRIEKWTGDHAAYLGLPSPYRGEDDPRRRPGVRMKMIRSRRIKD